MKPISDLIQRTGTENAFAVGPEIAKKEAEGWDIVRLTLGEPSGNIPEIATQEAVISLKHHETHYTPAQGLPALRAALADYMSTTRKAEFGPEHIVLTPGGKPVIWSTMACTINPGDEVLVPSPGYPIFESSVEMLGGRPVAIPILEEKGYSLDADSLEDLITAKTKAIIVNSPANPTGGVIPARDLEKIAKLCVKHDLWVLSDEAYARIVFGDNYNTVDYKGNTLKLAPSISSFPGMAERTVILAAMSKTYNGTGVRVGWATTQNSELAQRLTQIAINLWSCLPMYSQKALLACLAEDQTQAEYDLEQYREKAEIVYQGLNSIEGIKCVKPEGAFYALPNVTGACKKLGLKDAEEFRKYLLTYDQKNKKGVAVLARIHFGKKRPDEKGEFIRIAFPGSKEGLKQGIARIKEAVEG